MNLVEQLARASAASPPKRVLGIDLGTTNSIVAQVQLPLDPAGSPERLCECVSIERMTPSGPCAARRFQHPYTQNRHLSQRQRTFDCVILPKLVENNFQRVHGPRRHRLLLIGITWATQWVYLSTVRGDELKEVALLREAEAKGDLFVLTSAKSGAAAAPPPADEPVTEDSFL